MQTLDEIESKLYRAHGQAWHDYNTEKEAYIAHKVEHSGMKRFQAYGAWAVEVTRPNRVPYEWRQQK